MLATETIQTCPKMLPGLISSNEVHNMVDAFDLYHPTFLNDVLDRMDDLSSGFVYLYQNVHNHLQDYHYHWETLVWILLHNGQDEDKGGTRVYKRMKELQAEDYPNKAFLKSMQRHVSDEKRHARLFMQAAELIANEGKMEIVDNEDPKVGEDIVESLLTPVPMSLFKFVAAIYAIEFRSYIMIRNTIQHFTDALPDCAVMEKVIDIIKSIPADEKFHVEYTARFLEEELAKEPELYESRINEIVESMQHAGDEMVTYMQEHKQNIDSEGGMASLRKMF